MHRHFIWCFSSLTTALLLLGAGCSRQGKQAQFLARADRYFEKGQYDKAEADYFTVLRKDQEEPHALKGLGLIYFDQGRTERAGAYLFRALQKETNDLVLHERMAVCFLTVGQVKEARKEALFVLEHQRTNDEAPMVLLDCARNLPELTEIQQQLAQFSPTNAPQAGCEAALAALCLRRNPPDLPGAAAALRLGMAANPESVAINAALGVFCLTTNGLVPADLALRKAADLAPRYSPRRLSYARFKVQSRDPAGAEKVLRDIVKSTPDYLPAWLELARLAGADKKYDEALTCLEPILAREPGNFDAGMLRAQLKLDQGESAAAVAEFEKLAGRNPKSVKIQSELARAYATAGDATKAAAALHRVLNLDTNNVAAAMSLAQLDMGRGDLNAAIFGLQHLLQLKPDLDAARELLARCYFYQGALEEVAKIYRQLVSNHPTEPVYATGLGEILLDQGRRTEARTTLEQALQLAPKYPKSLPAIQQLVNLDLLEKQNDQAMQRVEQLITEAPEAPEPWLLKGGILLAFRTPQGTNQAEAALLKATELKPDYWPAYSGLAHIHKASHQNQKALADLRELVAKNPRDYRFLMEIGVILSDEKDFAGARATYESILKLNPKFIPALNNAAYLYSEHLGDLERAYKYAAKARDLTPTDPSVADTFGWVLFRRGEFAASLNPLQECAGKSPRDPEIQYHLGMAHYMMGQESAALQALKRSLELSPEFNGRTDAEKCLAILNLDPHATNTSALTTLEQRIAEQPADGVALNRLGQLYADRGQADLAQTTWQQALKANPQNVTVLVNLANLAEAAPGPHPDLHRALELAQTAYKLAPDDLRVLRVYGRLASRTGDYAVALGLLREAARQIPNDPDLQFEIAEAAYTQGDLTEAVRAARAAAQAGAACHRLADARRFLAFVDNANLPPAAALVDQTLASQPDFVPALMSRAELAEHNHDLKLAAQTFEKILTLNPNFSPATKRLAILYGAEPEHAKQAYKLGMQALAAYPGDDELVRTLGLLAYGQGDFERTVQLLQQLVDAKHADDRVWFCLGMAQNQLNRKSESTASLRRALELGLSGTNAAEANRILAAAKP